MTCRSRRSPSLCSCHMQIVQGSVIRSVAIPKARKAKLPSNGATGLPLRSTSQPDLEGSETVVSESVGLNTRTSSAPASRLTAETSAPSTRRADPLDGLVPPPALCTSSRGKEHVVYERIGIGAVDAEVRSELR